MLNIGTYSRHSCIPESLANECKEYYASWEENGRSPDMTLHHALGIIWHITQAANFDEDSIQLLSTAFDVIQAKYPRIRSLSRLYTHYNVKGAARLFEKIQVWVSSQGSSGFMLRGKDALFLLQDELPERNILVMLYKTALAMQSQEPLPFKLSEYE